LSGGDAIYECAGFGTARAVLVKSLVVEKEVVDVPVPSVVTDGTHVGRRDLGAPSRLSVGLKPFVRPQLQKLLTQILKS